MAANLVEKYGVVPGSLYPDSPNAQSTANMNRLIEMKLAKDALKLRALFYDGAPTFALAGVKSEMLQEVHLMLSLILGTPPSPTKNFTWEYYNSTKAFNSITITPKEFAAQLYNVYTAKSESGWDVRKLVSLVDDPRREYYRLLTNEFVTNMPEGKPTVNLNVPITVLKQATIAMLEDGIPVWFACNFKFYTSLDGFLNTKLYDYKLGLNVDLSMGKAALMNTSSGGLHAMVFTGVHLDESGNPVRWRVENSYSKEAGQGGYFIMSDDWMTQYVYQVIVDPTFLSSKVRDVLNQDPIQVSDEDAMGECFGVPSSLQVLIWKSRRLQDAACPSSLTAGLCDSIFTSFSISDRR